MTPTNRWLSIVGIGEDGWDGLNPQARTAIETAQILYGATRHLALLPPAIPLPTRIPWPSPMAPAVHEILTEHRGNKNVAVLASGDPMLYGVGVTLTRELAPIEFRVIPQVSSYSLACARLGWAIADTQLISLVNRPVKQLSRFIYPGQQLIVFSEDGRSPYMVARLLCEAGFGNSPMTVLESLGGPAERHTSGRASDWPPGQCGKLNLIAIVCTPGTNLNSLSLAPGLPDDAFETDGQLTKREIRAVTIARLAPLPHQCLWDVGAGTGSIGIEWMRVHPSCSCIAFETREDRVARIHVNAARFGVPTLKVIEGSAPSAFADLSQPDAIFMGGSVADEILFNACWAKLAAGGRLVANAVTLESEARLISRHSHYGGDLMRMMVSRADPVGSSYGWRPMMPITQWTVTKP